MSLFEACSRMFQGNPFLSTAAASRLRAPWTARHLFLFVCCTVLCWRVPPAPAQNQAATAQSSRFLLIIENSQAMESRFGGLHSALDHLVQHNLPQLMRKGDTLGMWTFNQELATGEFPLQRWNPDSQKATRDRILNFARTRWYQKPARFAAVLPSLERLIADSSDLTLILITTGDQNLEGFAAAAEINRVLTKWRKEQQRLKLPFVTVLRFKDGKPYDFAITPAPFPLELSPIPRPPEPIAATAPPREAARASTNAPSPPPPVGQPLILNGKRESKLEVTEPSPDTAPPPAAPANVSPIVAAPPPQATVASAPSPTVKTQTVAKVPVVTPPPVTPVRPPQTVVPEPAPKPTSSSTNRPTQSTTASTTLPSTASRTNAATTGVVATETTSSQLAVRWGAAGIGIIALGGAVFFVVRRRPAGSVSLITRSLEKHHHDHTP